MITELQAHKRTTAAGGSLSHADFAEKRQSNRQSRRVESLQVAENKESIQF
jgi:hypothetical protein